MVRNVRSSRIFDEDFDPLAANLAAANGADREAAPKVTPRAMIDSTGSTSSSKSLDGGQGHGGEWKRRSMPPSGSRDSLEDSKAIKVSEQRML